VLARRLHVLRRDAQPCPAAHRARVVEPLGHGDHHPARRDAEIEGLVQPFSAVLEQHVLSCDAELGCAVLNVGRDVRGPHDEQSEIAAAGSQDELARALRIVERAKSLLPRAAAGFRRRCGLSKARV